ncbi:hypothetical protein [Demequina sp.]|uniref:hypothetical protein n=1 Tax=Demequina sp. TaxID=2050685 RepID=UPI003D0E95CB
MSGPRRGKALHRAITAALAIAALVVAPAAFADSDKGTISGTVSLDPAIKDGSLDGLFVTVESTDTYRVVQIDDDDGTYEIKNLPNGAYTVMFGANAGLGGDASLLPEYYDDVYSEAAATPVVVVGGHVEGIDAQLSRVGHFTSAPKPKITYSALTAGSKLGSSTGTWVPVKPTFKYQWKRSGAAISGATKSTYVVTAADRGKTLTLTVTATATGYTSKSTTSAGVYIPKVFSKAPTPTISGTATSGKTLTAKVGTWSPKPALSYQWYRSGTKISGATKATYKLTSKDKGKKITVKVTGKKSGYLTVTKTSPSRSVAK